MWTPQFRLYFTARSTSLLGDAMLPVALTVGLLQSVHGAAGIGYAFAAWMAPIALLVLFAGVLSDRFSARRMMIGADAVRLLTLSAVAAGHLLAGAGFAFWGVMWATAVQTQVPQRVLNRVYAYDVAGSIMSIPIGRALAGPAGALAGERHILAASGLIAILSCLVLLAIPAVRGLARVQQ